MRTVLVKQKGTGRCAKYKPTNSNVRLHWSDALIGRGFGVEVLAYRRVAADRNSASRIAELWAGKQPESRKMDLSENTRKKSTQPGTKIHAIRQLGRQSPQPLQRK